MIKEKKALTKQILEKYPDTRGDGETGNFLNRVAAYLFEGSAVDFNLFNSESYVRARRKVLNECPHLDNRTDKNKEWEEIVRSEVI